MAQIEHYKGKLGFEHRSEEKLTLALTELLDALEEFGHPALQINARDPHRIGLDSDHYQITLRLRRMPLRLGVRAPKGLTAPAAYIELIMTPNFAEASDQEVSEILLAMVLQRLAEAMSPLVIFWQDSLKAMTLHEFLGAFTLDKSVEMGAQSGQEHLGTTVDTAVKQDPIFQDPACNNPHRRQPGQSMAVAAPPCTSQTPIARTSASSDVLEHAAATDDMTAGELRLQLADQARAEAEAERARGQALFGSVERATPVLEQHCNEILEGNSQHRRRFGRERRLIGAKPRHLAKPSWLTSGVLHALLAALSVPRSILSTTVNALRGIDLVVSVRALVTAIVVLFLHGSGMVQAAARVFLP